MKTISKDEVTQSMVLLDIRTPGEVSEGTIENSINIDFLSSDFKEKLNELDKNKTYVMFCRTGRRCIESLSIFEELGFNSVYMLEGNYLENNS